MFPPGKDSNLISCGLDLTTRACGKHPYFTRVPHRLHAEVGIITCLLTGRHPEMAQTWVSERLPCGEAKRPDESLMVAPHKASVHNVEEERSSLSCAICEIRKEKRFCPAVHGRICPQCCGEQREVTLDCPSDCPYLQQAREHEKPRSADEIDPAALFLQVEVPDQYLYEREHLLMGLTYALAKAAHSDRSLNDRDLIAALSALCASYQRLVNSGLHYEQPLTSASQQRVAAEVENMLKEYREAEQKHLGSSSVRDSDALKALAFLVRLAYGRTSGRPKSRAFVDFLLAQFPEKPAVEATQETGNRIIVP